MQIQYHQACSSIGTLLYIQLYVPTEYETTAGCSPRQKHHHTYVYMLDQVLANKRKLTRTLHTYVVVKLCLMLSLSDSESAHVKKLFHTVILSYILKSLRVKF